MPVTVHPDDGEKPQILYLGVDAGYFALLQHILRQAGFAATAVASPEDLQRQMARLKPTFVLIDMALGWPLQASAIDPLTRPAVAKIVLVGSRRDPIQASVLQRLQPSITLPRAGPPTQLLMHLEAALKRHDRPEPEILSCAGVELNLVSLRAFRDRRELHLGPIEFRLLRQLLREPTRVFSREQLAGAAWQKSVYVGSRTVDVHVARLRRALNQGTSHKLIRTARGMGYALV